jgi:hypothetical protein
VRAIKGYCDGQQIVPFDKDEKLPQGEVMITFLGKGEDDRVKTQRLLALFGSWQDDRPAEQIVREIYTSRKSRTHYEPAL